MKRNRLNIDYLNRYNKGESIWDIVKTEKITYKQAFEGIFDRRFEARLLPQEEKDKICKDYLNGISTVQLGKRYGISYKPIVGVLKDNNIEIDIGKSNRSNFANIHYFDVIDTPNKAYILGLLYADGTNTKYSLLLTLQEDDREILEKIRIELQCSNELKFKDRSKEKQINMYKKPPKNIYTLRINSKYLCDHLEKLGVYKNKSLILKFPDFISEELISHFLRGYIDGDGSISKTRYAVSFTSTESFCNSVNSILKKKFNINGTIADGTSHNGITKEFRLSRFAYSKLFLDYIYKDAELYMKRKYDIYLDRFVNNPKIINSTLSK